MTRRRIVGFAVCFALSGMGFARAASYEMADLQALEKQAQWQELFEHLEDIPPSKRDARWQALAERAASSWLGSIELKEDSAEGVLASSDAILRRYPMMKQSRSFMEKRAAVGLKAFLWTYGNYRHSSGDDQWLDQVRAFVAADPVTADLPLRAGKMVSSRLVACCAVPLFKLAVERSAGACKEPEVQRAIISGFEDGVWLREVSDLAQGRCWADLKVALVTQLDRTRSEDYAEHVCPLLKAKGLAPAKCAAP